MNCCGQTFSLENKKFVIYGAGAVGTLLKRLLIKESCFVESFVDARGDKMGRVEDLEVFSPDKFFQNHGDAEQYVIVITIKNVFEHSGIADLFIEHGYHNLIFKPRPVLLGKYRPEEQTINRAHDMLVIERRLPLHTISQSWEESQYVFDNKALISSEKKMVTVKIPIQMLYTNFVEDFVWSEKNFTVVYPLVELYQALLGTADLNLDESFKQYLYRLSALGAQTLNMELSESWAENIKKSRTAVCQEMDQLVDLDFEFFVRNCPTAKYEKGKFILTSSGKNRVAFLYAKGFRYIPVQIAENDYAQWLNAEAWQSLQAYLRRHKIHTLFSTIEHPCAYQFPAIFPQYRALCLEKLGRWLEKNNFPQTQSGRKTETVILDLWQDQGISSRYFVSLGHKVFRYMQDTEPTEHGLTKMLDTLLMAQQIPEADGDATRQYDVLLCSSKDRKETIAHLLKHDFRQVVFLNWGADKGLLQYLAGRFSSPPALISQASIAGEMAETFIFTLTTEEER